MKEMTERQCEALALIMRNQSAVHIAQIGNSIDRVLTGEWTTKQMKAAYGWNQIPEALRLEVSRLVDRWLYEADGNKGCDTERALRAYFKPQHGNTTPIMPAKFAV